MIAILMSALNISAYAIVPGEDSYMGQEDGYIQIDYKTQTQQFIPKSEIPEFNGDSSYDALNPAERARMDTINTQIAAYHNSDATVLKDVDNGEYLFVTSNLIDYMQFTGIVLVAVFDDGHYVKHGTGFMIDSQHFLTALHVVVEQDDDTGIVYPLNFYDEVRVYFGITESLGILDYDTFFNVEHTDYVRNSLGTYSTGTISYPGTTKYDWYIGTLETPVANAYYFDCAGTDMSVLQDDSYIVGYPGQYKYQMVITYGNLLNYHTTSSAGLYPLIVDTLEVSNIGERGMSGGPLYTMSSSLKCYGIFVLAADDCSFAVMFYDDFLDVIADIIGS